MSSRRRSRERALQVLYQRDMLSKSAPDATPGSLAEEGKEPPPDPFGDELAAGVLAKAEEIDQRIVAHSANWRLERMPVVDRNILRLAVYEMMNGQTPAAVVIDEALELARRFSGEDSVAFVNGVLDAVRKELAAPEAGPSPT